MNAEVEAYAGSSNPEAPRALEWEGQRYVVQEILDRRREPQGIGFLVRCTPGNTLFDLFYRQAEEIWRIQPKGFAVDDEQPTTSKV
jgi:hypothetical protein